MSLAATTTTSITSIDASSLKPHPLSSHSKLFISPASPIATAWSTDNSTLYIASARAIHAFSPSSTHFSLLFTPLPDTPPLGPLLLARGLSTLIFTQASTINLLAVSAHPPKITSSLTTHSANVTSLSLSTDASLLASVSSSGALHVYNLAHNANSVLRPFPAASRAPCVCAFDPHVRTRLFAGAGTTLVTYDISRPTGPVKTVSLADKSPSSTDVGRVVAISSSPYSKTLVAVACTTFVGLVDLEKEKPLFKTIPIKTPVTTMTFTADGSSIVVGVETGKVLVYDLRAIERPSRLFDVGNGDRVVALSIQKRIKGSPSATTARIPTSQSAPMVPHNTKSPVRRSVSSRTPLTPSKGRARKPDPPKRAAFSPPRVPVTARADADDASNISVQIETLMSVGADSQRKHNVKLRPSPSAVEYSDSAMIPHASSRVRSGSRKLSLVPSDATAPAPASVSVSPTRAGSHASDAPESDAARTRLSVPSSTVALSRTPTPDLSSINSAESSSWKRGLKALHGARDVLTTPDVERWVEAGRGPTVKQSSGAVEKRVGWAVDPDVDAQSDKENVAETKVRGGGQADEGAAPVYIGSASVPVAMDMSPVRRPRVSSGNALQISPLRASPVRGNGGGAQELLRAVVKDVMYEYRQETREEIMGLHLDLLKVGRSWKNELRTMMDEYVGDLRALREENARLRAENDRLRRGY